MQVWLHARAEDAGHGRRHAPQGPRRAALRPVRLVQADLRDEHRGVDDQGEQRAARSDRQRPPGPRTRLEEVHEGRQDLHVPRQRAADLLDRRARVRARRHRQQGPAVRGVHLQLERRVAEDRAVGQVLRREVQDLHPRRLRPVRQRAEPADPQQLPPVLLRPGQGEPHDQRAVPGDPHQDADARGQRGHQEHHDPRQRESAR